MAASTTQPPNPEPTQHVHQVLYGLLISSSGYVISVRKMLANRRLRIQMVNGVRRNISKEKIQDNAIGDEGAQKDKLRKVSNPCPLGRNADIVICQTSGVSGGVD
ncbi:hypothetical protein RvY_11831 [Ramazzottius varieornatus]|uniref:Uncharacterized protein n=1 Tax=Ramazzottius varieornatus TaxID=947166 RepID=A0A1D1VLQ5_RAMVA|nr:hypothetical protein RvY_11831 [Ramazzottius varieornatus]